MIMVWMMIKNIKRDSNNLHMNELIHQIVYLVKHKEDYESAASIMLDNLISLDELNEKTIKLTQLELAKLADVLIESRR